MSLYAVQDNVGNYWDFNNRGFHSPRNNPRRNTTFNLALADAIVQMNGGHVVELAEAPAKVVVSEKEADKLERAKVYGNPADVILALAANHHPDDAERLLHAYVNGWTVEKPKRYLLPMPDGTSDELDQGKYVAIRETGGIWHGSEHRHDITKQAELEYFFVTQADIDAAPDWVKAITPVEVTDDDAKK